MELRTASYVSVDDGFPNVRIVAKASEFMKTLDSLTNYDDGQGRKFDILDEEIYD